MQEIVLLLYTSGTTANQRGNALIRKLWLNVRWNNDNKRVNIN
jgi:acyl-coenzyme A synthetase/AMP-(fatty) acid ligase